MDARVVVAKALAADKFAAWCAELPPGCLVALEACGGAHHWARKLRGYGLDARLIARWIDSTILDVLYGWGFGADRPHTNFDPLIGLNNAFGDMLLNFVMAMMFIVLPTFWVMALAWAGVRTGNIVQGLSTATSDAKGAGGRGAGMAMSAVSKK